MLGIGRPNYSLSGILLQFERGIDKREVRKALRKVAEEVAALRVDLLGVEADVVRELQELFHQADGRISPPEDRERFDQPEGTREKRSLGAFDSVLSRVTTYERAVGEVGLDRVDGREQARVVRVAVCEEHSEEQARVEVVAPCESAVAVPRGRPALAVDECGDRTHCVAPLWSALGWEVSVVREANGTVERDPAHH